MIDRVQVCLELDGTTVVAGTAWFTQRRGTLATSFSYDSVYLRNPRAWPIDPTWPLFEGNHHAAGLPGSFRDCSPDRWGRNLVRKRLAAAALADGGTPPSVGDVDFLLGVSDRTRQGALRFRVDEGGPFLDPASAVPQLIELPRLLRASDAVAGDGGGFSEVKELLDAGSGSLGGARPKASVLEGARLHIAKFPHPGDEWDVMAWEKVSLDLAARAGIRVPPGRLIRIEGRAVLLVERFDRHAGSRTGYVSAMTLVGAHDGDVLDHTDLAGALPEFSARTSRDLRELWRRVAFSVAIHNTDDHLRNVGFLRHRGGWILSPLFDVNPDPDLRRARATSVGGGRTTDDEITGLIASASEFRLNPSEARGTLRDVVEAVSSWTEVAIANRVPAAEHELFAPIFEDRLRGLSAAAF